MNKWVVIQQNYDEVENVYGIFVSESDCYGFIKRKQEELSDDTPITFMPVKISMPMVFTPYFGAN